jgi:hypothetical protein
MMRRARCLVVCPQLLSWTNARRHSYIIYVTRPIIQLDDYIITLFPPVSSLICYLRTAAARRLSERGSWYCRHSFSRRYHPPHPSRHLRFKGARESAALRPSCTPLPRPCLLISFPHFCSSRWTTPSTHS